eukprot:2862842-Ditylum_brightwellii.AAC.1
MLTEFEAMLNMLVVKNTNIFHAKVPAALIPSAKLPKECPAGDLDGDKGSTKCPKMTPYNPSKKLHPKIKTAFVDRMLKQVPNVTLYNICHSCNTTITALLPDNKRCAQYMVGMCHQKRCECKHETVLDAEAEHVLKLPEKAVKILKTSRQIKASRTSNKGCNT